jgi:hypothetical protein
MGEHDNTGSPEVALAYIKQQAGLVDGEYAEVDLMKAVYDYAAKYIQDTMQENEYVARRQERMALKLQRQQVKNAKLEERALKKMLKNAPQKKGILSGILALTGNSWGKSGLSSSESKAMYDALAADKAWNGR